MKIGIVGGTGAEGSGLAIRWARAGHQVTIGSRSVEKGAKRAAELSAEAGKTIAGSDNPGCCAASDIVLLSVPYSGHGATVESLKEALAGKVVIDITVPLQPPKVRSVNLPGGNAAALEAQAILGDSATVVAAFHHISAGRPRLRLRRPHLLERQGRAGHGRRARERSRPPRGAGGRAQERRRPRVADSRPALHQQPL